MTTLKTLKNRIHAIGETQKITTAMMLVAGAKLRKAEQDLERSQPFISGIEEILETLPPANQMDQASAYFMQGTGHDKTHLVIVMSSDRGLCGAFNSSIVREVKTYLNDLKTQDKEIQILPLGRRGEELLKGIWGSCFIEEWEDVRILEDVYEKSRLLSERLISLFRKNACDVCTLFFSKFHSVIQQKVERETLFPIMRLMDHLISQEKKTFLYEFEPHQSEFSEKFFKDFLMTRLLYGFLETKLSEQGARMMAMDGAVRNAKEMISHLKLTYNRSRQASITKELIEIISGAEAL